MWTPKGDSTIVSCTTPGPLSCNHTDGSVPVLPTPSSVLVGRSLDDSESRYRTPRTTSDRNTPWVTESSHLHLHPGPNDTPSPESRPETLGVLYLLMAARYVFYRLL